MPHLPDNELIITRSHPIPRKQSHRPSTMSLLAPRMTQPERASVVLPTVTCSSCSDSIPLSSLGEHVCRAAPRTIGRSAPRPAQIAIPPPGAHSATSSSWRGPSSFEHAPPRPAFAGPSSAVSSPGSSSLMIPDVSSGRSSPIGGLSPHGGSSPSPRTPSPTNPFFPQIALDDKGGNASYGLGLNVSSKPEGPFPTDAPLPKGASDLSALSGESGMAGVGRRTFQAAAWGVTAGMGMAQSVRNRQPEHSRPPLPPSSFSSPGPASAREGSQSAGPVPSSLPPWQSHMPLHSPAPYSTSSYGRQRSGTDATSPPRPFEGLSAIVPQRSASAMDRPAQPFAPPARSTSAMSANPPGHRSKPSVASTTSSRSSYDKGDSVSQLLRARTNTNERKGSNDGKGNFFDKYKEMQRTNSKSSAGTFRLLPGDRRDSQDDVNENLVDSPRQSVLDLDDEASALPWATPALAGSPDIKQSELREKTHHRQPTAGSDSSSASSRSGRYGASGGSCEDIVTPGGSLEGLSLQDRAVVNGNARSYGARPLKEIQETEEEENDRVVFGTLADSPPRAQTKPHTHMVRSGSSSTINTTTKDSATSHSHSQTRSRTAPVRRIKTCQKCGDTVGGTKKFVERDGVVLCEADWKKMYLPSCRKCSKLIETKMVSADDGQLKGKWHSACFTCTRCDEPFEDGDFYVHAGKPWCQYHYAQET